MSMAHVVGVDPGLVHTGVVSLRFMPSDKQLLVGHALVPGPDAQAVAHWVSARPGPTQPKVYVEQYRTRQQLTYDGRMLALESDLRRALPGARFLPNMGVKRVITQELMEMLEVWRFGTVSHHQDLRSAARIALLGLVKDDDLNWYLAEMVRECLDGQLWTVDHV